MLLSLGFSTCPNDTFMFDAMVNGRIDTEGLSFNSILSDIEKLNNYAIHGELDIVKISYALYPKISDKYQILNAGSALGHGNGPILVSKNSISPDNIDNLHIAIPGFNTTANLLLSIAYPNMKKKNEFLFSDIEEAVIRGKVDAGLLIHEGRFTYQAKGLKLFLDLGTWWEEHTDNPIPLGGIMVRRDLPKNAKLLINKVLRSSVSYAFEHPDASVNFIKRHAHDMDDNVIKQHIQLYVNEYSIDLGSKGRRAIEILFEKASDMHKISNLTQPIFAV